MAVISVVVPTVTGREEHLERCVRTYAEHAPGNYDLDMVVELNHPTCGLGWQAGLEKIQGDYVHFTCDDIAPHAGWSWPAIEAVEAGFIPAPQVYGPGGDPQSHPQWGHLSPDWSPVYMTSLPFVSRAQLEKIVPLFTSHYFSDDWFSFRGERAGWPTRLRCKYAFTHHWASHLRGAGMPEGNRLNYDALLYERAKLMVERGEWTEPWPPVEISRPNG